MHKFSKISTFALFGVLAVGATSCSNPRGKVDLHFWHNFGANYSDSIAKSLIDPYWEETKINVKATSKGSYDKLKEQISGTLSTLDFPNLATGYPDHFADYARSGYPTSRTGVLLNLNPYIDAYKEKTGIDLRSDYYPEYMIENDTIAYDENDNPLTVGLPFNKSTEVIGYNGIFFDYVKSKNSSVKVPETWDEWKTYGPIFRQYQMELNGKYLCGARTEEGTASNFHVETSETDDVLLDFSEATNEESAVLSWDSLANMFITLVRQFGSEFTSYTTADRKATKIDDQHGYMEFYSETNKAKTIEAMQLVRDLSGTNDATRIFATPTFFGGSYASDAFAENKVLFTVCSTGGLSYNINEGQRFRVAPVPYKDAEHKFVISQGANMTVFDQANIDNKEKYTWEETKQLAFDTIVKFTTGEYQAKWATLTGYYPASKSAAESETYQRFIDPAKYGDPVTYDDPIAVAYREGAKLNNDEYMDASKHWIKFVDPGFPGSAAIRLRVDSIITKLISYPDKTIDEILQEVYSDPQVSKFVRK